MQESALLTVLAFTKAPVPKSLVEQANLSILLRFVQQHWRFEWLETALEGRPMAQPLGSSEDDPQAPWLREHASWALDPYLSKAATLTALLSKALSGRRWPWLQMLLEQATLLPLGARGAVLPQAVAALDVHGSLGVLPAPILGQLLSAGLRTVQTKADSRQNLLHVAFVSAASPEVIELILQRTDGKDMSALLTAQVALVARGWGLGLFFKPPYPPFEPP